MERRARLREQWSDPARPAIQSLEGTSRLKEVGVDVHALNRLLGSVPGNNESPIAAAALNLQGNVLTGDGMEMEAIPLYEKALALLSKRLGAGHPDVKVVEENLRECRRRMDTPASR
jgi:predicted negative regulator of RcsB-dependent stress response